MVGYENDTNKVRTGSTVAGSRLYAVVDVLHDKNGTG